MKAKISPKVANNMMRRFSLQPGDIQSECDVRSHAHVRTVREQVDVLDMKTVVSAEQGVSQLWGIVKSV